MRQRLEGTALIGRNNEQEAYVVWQQTMVPENGGNYWLFCSPQGLLHPCKNNC
jgi:hypothetical protein